MYKGYLSNSMGLIINLLSQIYKSNKCFSEIYNVKNLKVIIDKTLKR